jgi:hypothetical protein
MLPFLRENGMEFERRTPLESEQVPMRQIEKFTPCREWVKLSTKRTDGKRALKSSCWVAR